MPGAICTIIIPTHERHDILLRAIDYYQHFDCNVSIADSSARKMNYEFPDNFTYEHLPCVGFATKIFKVAKDVTTPYVCLVNDDDYLIESSLKAGACFLNDNPDYASTQGRYYKFELIENQVIFSPRYDLDSFHHVVESEDRVSRFVRAFNPYNPLYSAIHRTDLFTKSFQISGGGSSCKETFLKGIPLTEILVPFIPMFYGKYKAIPVLWMVRDSFIFDKIRRQKVRANKSDIDYSASYNFRRYTHAAKAVENFLNSEEFRQLKKSFRDTTSGVVINKESDMLFNLAFKSYIKWLISDRNKVVTKIIIKLFTPNWVLKHFKARKKKQYASGIEETLFESGLNKVRLSVLAFRKCYDGYRE